MGTNYYVVEPPCPNPCKHCQPGEWHICKSLISFQAYDESPFGSLESWAQWKTAILEHRLVVRDEYGTTHATEDFIREVEATPTASRRRQYDWMMGHGGNPQLDEEYLDGDGFSFYRGSFS